jgi:undecaprenyl-diphosphatase
MSIIEALSLGVLQGITEFLPVSSSGHLVLLQKIFGINEAPLFFDTMLHAGTLIAVLIVLRTEVLSILRKPFQKLTLFLVAGTVPLVITTLFLGDFIEKAFTGGKILGFCFLFTSIVLFFAEKIAEKCKTSITLSSLTWKKAFAVGACQAIAILPAVSRSGMTIFGSVACKLDKTSAARFSFLLSIPAILGALALQLKHLLFDDTSLEVSTPLIPVIIGTLAAAIVGIVSIKFFLTIVKDKSFYSFAIYTAVLGVVVVGVF